MKNMMMLIAGMLMIAACETGEIDDLSVDSTTDPTATESVAIVTDELATSIVFMREEEKMARDVYLYLFESWNQAIFENIAASEQKHMDAVKGLIVQFGLTDPVAEDAQGQFQNENLQYLYDSLTVLGGTSLENALRVGALIEEVDILDLDNSITGMDQADVLTVYNNLNKGSRNHLRNFYGNLQTIGADYTPQILEETYFYEIVNSAMETGGNGKGHGNG